MAWTSQKMPIFDNWPLTVTLTFDIGSRVLYATHLLMTLNNLTKFYEVTTITYQVMARTSHKMPIFDLWPRSVTLTFDIGPRIIYATRLLMTLNNLTKFYEATTITYQVMARPSHKMPFFYLWPVSVTLTFDIEPRILYDTPTHDTEQFDKVLWSYNNYLSSYGPDKPYNAHFWPLTSKCDLDLWHRATGLIRDTPTHDTEQFDKVLWRYNNNLSSYGPDKVGRTHGRTDGCTDARTDTKKNCGDYVSRNRKRARQKFWETWNF